MRGGAQVCAPRAEEDGVWVQGGVSREGGGGGQGGASLPRSRLAGQRTLVLIGTTLLVAAQAIWAIGAAPLFMSNDLRNVSAASKAILLNKHLLVGRRVAGCAAGVGCC